MSKDHFGPETDAVPGPQSFGFGESVAGICSSGPTDADIRLQCLNMALLTRHRSADPAAARREVRAIVKRAGLFYDFVLGKPAA